MLSFLREFTIVLKKSRKMQIHGTQPTNDNKRNSKESTTETIDTQSKAISPFFSSRLSNCQTGSNIWHMRAMNTLKKNNNKKTAKVLDKTSLFWSVGPYQWPSVLFVCLFVFLFVFFFFFFFFFFFGNIPELAQWFQNTTKYNLH